MDKQERISGAITQRGNSMTRKNKQHEASTNTCTCPYCRAVPGQYCVTAGGSIATRTHWRRLEAYGKRVATPAAKGETVTTNIDWVPIPAAGARIVVLEVVLPPAHPCTNDVAVEEALREGIQVLERAGWVYQIKDILVAHTVADARNIIASKIHGQGW